MKDREEEYIQHRDMVEYQASFIEPEAVRKIRESREKAVEVSDDQFTAGLERFFGRAFTAKRKKGGKIESVNPSTAITNYKATEAFENTKSGIVGTKGRDYKHWLNSDLE
ncbi:hypothetical protein LCGC14_1759750 [marine sediment metagenome]|uniref:Uncharacterized protein n=1 Tax=marine sediment metagenome TaxID=412755 RepID=A0A0F9H1I2_9ZZZZ